MPVGDGSTQCDQLRIEPGDETQWDWLDLPDPARSWGWGRRRASAGRVAGAFEQVARHRCSRVTDESHLVAGLDRVSRALGGVTRSWRFDRMSTVCDPGSGRITACFAGVAKHYSVAVGVSAAPREPQGRGGKEQSHGRATLVAHLARRCHTPNRPKPTRTGFAAGVADIRMRATAEGKSTVAAIAETEPLQPVPAAPYPVIVAEQRICVAPSAGGLPRQPLLGAARTGHRPGHGHRPGRWRVSSTLPPACDVSGHRNSSEPTLGSELFPFGAFGHSGGLVVPGGVEG